MKKIIVTLIMLGMVIFAGCSTSDNSTVEVEEIYVDQEEASQNEEDILTQGLIEDDDSQEIGSLI